MSLGYYAAFYLVVLSLLALHLHHGAWSLFQTLGIDNPDRNPGLRRFALVVTVGIFLVFASVPIAFYSGVMPTPPSHPPFSTDASNRTSAGPSSDPSPQHSHGHSTDTSTTDSEDRKG